MLTVRQIKIKARSALNDKMGDALTITMHAVTNICMIALLEFSLYLILARFGLGYYYDLRNIVKIPWVAVMWGIQALVIISFLTYQRMITRRLFVDISVGKDYIPTRQYIFAHTNEFIRISLRSSLIMNFLKAVMFSPIVLSVYLIYMWGQRNRTDELTSLGLFVFMLCIGFTIIWTGIFIKYCASLALAPYIMSLNPRTNVFDACDLSAKLMDGHYGQYLSVLLSFVVYLPLMILIYPIFVIYPFLETSYSTMVKDIMGDYWQDKVPAMIRRWQKYQK